MREEYPSWLKSQKDHAGSDAPSLKKENEKLKQKIKELEAELQLLKHDHSAEIKTQV